MLYRLATLAYHLGVRLVATFGHRKAKAWLSGRKMTPAVVKKIQQDRAPAQRLIWMHAASLGEFEQGRPVLELYRSRHPKAYYVLTFFSPSGFERMKDYPGVDAVAYLPMDTPDNATQWVRELAPSLAIFVKYEFWFYHLRALHRADVPTILIAGSFRAGQPFFQWYGARWRKMLHFFSQLIVQSPQDEQLLLTANIPSDRIAVAGDPRADRVLQIGQAPFDNPTLAAFCDQHHILVAGSVWPPDVAHLEQLLPHLTEDWKILLVPHELRESELTKWAAAFSAARYTQASASTAQKSRVLILDTVGMLSRVYRYATLAYIGGGFGRSIHNTLEPMAYGVPVFFGPRHKKFPEANKMVAAGGCFSFRNFPEFLARWQAMQDPIQRRKAEEIVRSYMEASRGAAEDTVALIETVEARI